MAEQRYLILELYSRRSLDVDFAQAQLKFLADFNGGTFIPEKCDVFEPLKQKFDPSDLEAQVRWLSQPGGEFKFKRTRPVRMEGHITNLRFAQIQVREDAKSAWQEFSPTAPEPVFCTRWTIWIGLDVLRKIGFDLLKRFFVELFNIAEADFAFLTTEDDHKNKNYKVSRDSQGTNAMFVGDDPEKGIPGLYWINLFGPLYVEWFGAERITALSATVVERQPNGSVFIQFAETPEEAESIDIRQRQSEAIAVLGQDGFFDIDCPDRILKVPNAILKRRVEHI